MFFCYILLLPVISDICIRSSTSPESGLGTSHLSLGPGGTEGEHFQDIDDEDDEEFFEPEPLPVLGRCTALYTFQGHDAMISL